MATWGPIQLRLKGSRQVEFEGEASPAPGGGAMPVQGSYGGDPVTVKAGDAGTALTWDSLVDGTELLDHTDPANPTFLAAGAYVVSILVDMQSSSLPANSAAIVTLSGPGVTLNANQLTGVATQPGGSGEVGMCLPFIAAAGDSIGVFVTRGADGGPDIPFALQLANVVKFA